MESLKLALGFFTEPWVLLAMLASLAFAGMNYIDEYLLNDAHEDEETPVGTLIIISGLFGGVIAYAAGIGTLFFDGVTVWIPTDLRWQAVLVGFLEIVWLIPYLYAAKRAGALDAAPLFQTIPVISGILGVIFFAEVPPWMHIVGSVLVVCGAFLLNTSLETLKLDWGTIGLMLLSSTIIAAIYFFFKDVAQETSFLATAFWSGIGMVLAACCAWLVCPPYRKQFNRFVRSRWGKNLVVQLVNEVIDTVAVSFAFLATLKGPTVMVATALNGYQPLFILLIGFVLAKAGSKNHQEQLGGSDLWKHIVSIVLIAAGTACIAVTTSPS